jgi:ABC-type glycerol-3-phosphate transport system substrate-binding protein
MANYIHMLRPNLSQRLVPYALERYLPRVARPFNYDWGVAPFPSVVGGPKLVTYAGADVLVIPRGARHPREAFEFIAYVNRQDVMEKLCQLHCKNSPLAKVSDSFIRTHPNPYIDVFERLAASPNAQGALPVAISGEVGDEIGNMTQRVIKLEQTPEQALAQTQQRIEAKLARYEKEEARRRAAGVIADSAP